MDTQMFSSGSIAFAVYSMGTLGFKESTFVHVQTAKTMTRLCGYPDCVLSYLGTQIVLQILQNFFMLSSNEQEIDYAHKC